MKHHAVGTSYRRTRSDFKTYLDNHEPKRWNIKGEYYWFINNKMVKIHSKLTYGKAYKDNAPQLFEQAYKEWSKHKVTSKR